MSNDFERYEVSAEQDKIITINAIEAECGMVHTYSLISSQLSCGIGTLMILSVPLQELKLREAQ